MSIGQHVEDSFLFVSIFYLLVELLADVGVLPADGCELVQAANGWPRLSGNCVEVEDG